VVVCVYVGFVICGCMYVCVLYCVGVCRCGFCNVCVCVCMCGFCNVGGYVCVGFVMCAGVYVWVL